MVAAQRGSSPGSRLSSPRVFPGPGAAARGHGGCGRAEVGRKEGRAMSIGGGTSEGGWGGLHPSDRLAGGGAVRGSWPAGTVARRGGVCSDLYSLAAWPPA